MNPIEFNKKIENIISLIPTSGGFNGVFFQSPSHDASMACRRDIKQFFISDYLRMTEMISAFIRDVSLDISIKNEEIIEGLGKVKNSVFQSWNYMNAFKPYEEKYIKVNFNSEVSKNINYVLDFIEFEIEQLKLNPIKFKTLQPKDGTQKDYTKNIWFKVGLLFANGEMAKLIEQYSINGTANGTKIAEHLGNKSYKGFINETISNNLKNITDKNIFSNQKKLLKIKKYCDENNIVMVDSFLKLITSK